jgi:hypothetical protein
LEHIPVLIHLAVKILIATFELPELAFPQSQKNGSFAVFHEQLIKFFQFLSSILVV